MFRDILQKMVIRAYLARNGELYIGSFKDKATGALTGYHYSISAKQPSDVRYSFWRCIAGRAVVCVANNVQAKDASFTALMIQLTS